jgi:anti-anti-sigma factor
MASVSDSSLVNSAKNYDESSICKLEIEGDLSGHRVKKLEDEFAEALSSMTYKKVVLNISTAHNIDSPGLALCVGLYKECLKKKIDFLIIANQDICKIIKLVNLDRILPIKESN